MEYALTLVPRNQGMLDVLRRRKAYCGVKGSQHPKGTKVFGKKLTPPGSRAKSLLKLR